MDRKIALVLLLSLATRIAYLFFNKNIWWDAAVYLSMGKFLFTFGQFGLWEPIRPLAWPFLLGYGFILGLDPVIWGHILSTAFSLGTIYLTYEIARKLTTDRAALLASILLSLTWVFFFFNSLLYTEIPAIFFGLCAYYCFLKDKPFHTGLFVGLAFLTKFPMGIFLIIFGIFFLKPFKRVIFMLFAFFIITLPYFVFNTLAYGSPFTVLLFAQEFLQYAGIWIFQQPWWYYAVELVKQNIVYLFAIPGSILALKKKRYALVLLTIVPLLYFSHLAHKEVRFVILFLPFLAIIAAYGYDRIFKETESFIAIALLFFILNFSITPAVTNDYFTFFDGKDIEGEILVTHPLSAYYAEKAVIPLYYPWFNASQATYWISYITSSPPEFVAIDTCEGGLLCPPDDEPCEGKKQDLLTFLDEEYTTVWNKTSPTCTYVIYQSTDTSVLTN